MWRGVPTQRTVQGVQEHFFPFLIHYYCIQLLQLANLHHAHRPQRIPNGELPYKWMLKRPFYVAYLQLKSTWYNHKDLKMLLDLNMFAS